MFKTKGQRIHELRNAKGMTLEELGKSIGVGKATIKKYENGIIENIPSDKISAMATVLDSTPQYIMGWTDNSSNKDDEIVTYQFQYAPRTDEARIISGGIDRMPEAKRKRALEMFLLMASVSKSFDILARC